MKKTIALMLAMLFAVCAFATTAFADPADTDATQATTEATTQATTEPTTNDDPNDGFNTTTTKADETTTKADETTTAKDDSTTTTAKNETTTAADVTATLAPGETAYEGQGSETSSTTKKPASVDTTIPSTGSGIVVPAIALAVLAAGTVAVIKSKKED